MKAASWRLIQVRKDIHTFVESELTARLGQTGKRLHTARSRNDQVALDIRMTLKKEIDAIAADIKDLLAVLCKKAEENKGVILPGYTHLQRAQPITFGHHLMAYAAMLCRDLDRLADVKKTHECAAPGQRRSGRHHLPHRPANGGGAAGL